MSYNLDFVPEALKEWECLDNGIRHQFKKKLTKILEAPHIPGSRLNGFDCAYKIKLRSAGFRLVYEVYDDTVTVLVLAVGKRESNAVYDAARTRR